jgi:6-phosphogluconolactonase
MSASGGSRMSLRRWLRGFARTCLLPIVPLAIPAIAGAAGDLVYVGTYTGHGSQGIYAFRFDPASGGSVSLGLAAETENPSFLTVDPKGRFLYAVNETGAFQGQPTGAISVFGIDRGTGRLDLRQQVASLGRDPAHLSLDKTGRYLLVATYSGGNIAVFPIGGDGRLGPHSAFVQHAGSSVNPERQAGPHPHSIQVTPGNRSVLVTDLGLDELLVYRFDANKGSLTPDEPGSVRLDPGAGPRHIAFAPSGRFMYAVNELSSTVAVFACESGQGALVRKQTVPTLPKGFAGKNTAAEIAVDAAGRFLYVSNRGDDSLAVFGIDPDDGHLTPIERVQSGGRGPRHFAIDPTGRWLFAANQGSNDVKLFRVDPASGRLEPTTRTWKVISPVCVLIVPAPSPEASPETRPETLIPARSPAR